jgi:hypothetical protein
MKTITPLLCTLLLSCSGPAVKDTAQTDATKAPAAISPIPLPSSPESLQQGEPFLFTDPAGRVYLSWIEKTDSLTHRMRYATLTDSGWTNPATIASGHSWFVNWADYPQFAADGEGHFIATFLQKSGAGKYAYDIMLTRSSGGQQWTEPVRLNEDGKDAEHGFVSIAPFGSGLFLLSWLDGRNTKPMTDDSHDHAGHGDAGAMSIRAAVVDTNGRKQTETELDNRTCDCCQTATVVSSTGPLVVYRDRSDNETRDIWMARMENGRWLQPQRFSNDNWVINGCPVNGPRAEAIGQTVGVTWYTEGIKPAAVYVAFSRDGGKTFAQPVRIHDSIPLGRVDIVLTDTAHAWVSWMEGGNILARAVQTNGTADPSRLVAQNSAARNAGFPQMARWRNRLVFAWTDAGSRQIMTGYLEP